MGKIWFHWEAFLNEHYKCNLQHTFNNSKMEKRTGLVLLLVTSALAVSMTESVKECPPWFKWVNTSDSCGYCACGKGLPWNVLCNQEKQESSIRLGFCTFYDSAEKEVTGALCMSLFPKHTINDEHLIPLPQNVSELNTFVCGSLNRELKGPLCGKCTGDTGPSIYSVGNQCVPCSPVNVVYYLLLQYLPSTILFLVVILFRLNVTAAPMAHYVLFCNLVVFYSKSLLSFYATLYGTSTLFISTLVKSVVTITAVWSFDPLFFLSPPLCVSRHMEDIYKPFLDFIATLYPFLLLLLTYSVIDLHARNFKLVVSLKKLLDQLHIRFYSTWEPNASIIQAFSSLFFLSYAKLNILITMVFLPVLVTNTDGITQRTMVYIDTTVPYFSTKHIILIIFSGLIAIIFYFPPLLFLIVYPSSLYRKISDRIKAKCRIAIKTYVETFQSCYKDGLNGTRDYRAISGYSLALFGFLPVMIQAIITKVLPLAFTSGNSIPQYITIVFFTVMTVLCALLQPYKQRIANASAVAVPAIITALFALSTGFKNRPGSDMVRVMMLILLFAPHCALGYYVVRKMKMYITNTCHLRCGNIMDTVRGRGRYATLLSVQ